MSTRRSKSRPPKVFQCSGHGDCKMTFTRSEHLARHIRKHTGERPFRCHCNRAFSRLDNLRQHAQTVHANEGGISSGKVEASSSSNNNTSTSNNNNNNNNNTSSSTGIVSSVADIPSSHFLAAPLSAPLPFDYDHRYSSSTTTDPHPHPPPSSFAFAAPPPRFRPNQHRPAQLALLPLPSAPCPSSSSPPISPAMSSFLHTPSLTPTSPLFALPSPVPRSSAASAARSYASPVSPAYEEAASTTPTSASTPGQLPPLHYPSSSGVPYRRPQTPLLHHYQQQHQQQYQYLSSQALPLPPQQPMLNQYPQRVPRRNSFPEIDSSLVLPPLRFADDQLQQQQRAHVQIEQQSVQAQIEQQQQQQPSTPTNGQLKNMNALLEAASMSGMA